MPSSRNEVWEIVKSSYFAFKSAELTISTICFLCLGTTPISKPNEDCASSLSLIIIHVAFYGYFLLNAVVIMGFLLSESMSKQLIIAISASGCFFNVVAGFVLIASHADSQVHRRILASGLISLINAAVFGLDTYYTVKYIGE